MRFEENRETYGKIATLYYMGEYSQDEIASIFRISRFKVSRILRKCRELNIVEFHINSKPIYYKKLEADLSQALGLSSVTIVKSGSTPDASKVNVGRAAARYLLDSLRDGMTIGFDWGTTLQTMVREFAPQHSYPNALFLQISGSVASQSIMNTGYMDGHDIVKSLASKAGANWSLFPVPYIVGDHKLHDLLMQEPSIRKHVELFQRLDIAFFGLGSTSTATRMPFYKNYLSPEECAQLTIPDGFGELFSQLIQVDGTVQDSILSGRVMTIDPMVLKRIPHVLVLAAGNDKTLSLIAGARGKFFNELIADEICAISCMEYLEKNR